MRHKERLYIERSVHFEELADTERNLIGSFLGTFPPDSSTPVWTTGQSGVGIGTWEAGIPRYFGQSDHSTAFDIAYIFGALYFRRSAFRQCEASINSKEYDASAGLLLKDTDEYTVNHSAFNLCSRLIRK